MNDGTEDDDEDEDEHDKETDFGPWTLDWAPNAPCPPNPDA